MFTGIVEEIGIVKSVQSKVITIEANKIFDDLHLGDSVAVNGTCLTVSSFDNKIFNADVTQETLNRTNLGSLKNGSRVNLERAMTLSGRFGGHIVSGHIDGVFDFTSLKVCLNLVGGHSRAVVLRLGRGSAQMRHGDNTVHSDNIV